MKFAVIGAGNGGQAIAGYLGMQGHSVNIYDIDAEKLSVLDKKRGIILEGKLNGYGKINYVTNELSKAILGVDVIMITTVANVHRELAMQLSPILENNQIVILNPGRTCGALDFKMGLTQAHCNKKIYIAEAQTLVYACRAKETGRINIIGIKDCVFLAAIPAVDTAHVINVIKDVYPCFKPSQSVLHTSLENIGAIFHPCVVLFNAATIERGEEFYFYRDMTSSIAQFIEKFDEERIAVGKAYGIDLVGVSDWISLAYKGTKGDSLCEKMKNNPAYNDILAPVSIFSRQLIEDLPTGILPILELGKAAGLKMSLFESILNVCTELLSCDFRINGRTLKSLGLNNLSKDEILNYIK